MKFKSWILAGVLFVVSCTVWGAYVLSSRAFLRDLNAGVHAYLGGQFIEAEKYLESALKRRPKNTEARQLFTKVLIEKSYAQYNRKEYADALASLDRAAQTAGDDAAIQESLKGLRAQLSVSEDQRPRPIAQVLASVYKNLPEQSQPANIHVLLQQWFERSQASQETLLKRFSENQERWLSRLEREKDQFRRVLYGGLVLFGVCGVGLLISLLGILHAYFGRRGVFSRLLEEHYQRIVSALPAGSHVLLGPPVSLHHIPEAKQMDVIEAEILMGEDTDAHTQRLQSLLSQDDPWVRARASKILYGLNPQLALDELRRMVEEDTPSSQVPAIWALSELSTIEAIDLLQPMAYSHAREIQQGAIRSLLQMNARPHLPLPVKTRLDVVLSEVRTRTGWIF